MQIIFSVITFQIEKALSSPKRKIPQFQKLLKKTNKKNTEKNILKAFATI